MLKKISLGVFCIMIAFSFVACGAKSVKEDDFLLEITVSSNTFYQGEDIEVEIVFKNLSGKRLHITRHNIMIAPYIIEEVIIQHEDGSEESIYTPPAVNLITKTDVIKRNEVRISTHSLGSRLPAGEFTLIAAAAFAIKGASDWILVHSNTINLIVLEK